jgi:hypothetical protein
MNSESDVSTGFDDYQKAQRWFAKHPREVVIAMSARAALRVLPFITAARGEKNFIDGIVTPVFRAAHVTWVAGRYPGYDKELRAAARASASSAHRAGGIARGPDAHNAASVAAPYAVTTSARAAAALASADATVAAGDAAGYAGGAASHYGSVRHVVDYVAAERIIVDAAKSDADAIERGFVDPMNLALARLWPKGAPDWASNAWVELKEILLVDGDGWDMWVRWYEDRLAGRPSLGQSVDLAIATLPNELWEQGSAAVNTRIKELIAEHTPASLPTQKTLPAQTGQAVIFQPEPNGVIGVTAPTPEDRLANNSEVGDLYGETREKLDNLIALGRNLLGDRLDRASRRLQSRMPEVISEAIERQVWSSGNTLRCILAAHDAVKGDHDPHPDKLDNGAAERLRDAVDTFNQLAVADPSLRRRDASRPGPQEYERSLDEIRVVVEITRKAATARTITTQEAGDELTDSVAVTDDPSSRLPDRLAIEQARETTRNFWAGIALFLYQGVRSFAAGALLEGGKVPNELFSGLYRWTMPATLTALSLHPDVVNLFISNLDLLKLYAGYAFEQSPGFKQMIDWLEAHVRIEK